MQIVPKGKGEGLDPKDIKREIEDNIELLAEAEHEGWVAEKRATGWRQAKEGQKRNDNEKIHDCLVPYSELPEKDKEKDRNSVRGYPEIVARAGYRIVYET